MVNENLNFNNIEDEEPGFDFKTIIMKLFICWGGMWGPSESR